MKIHCQKTPSVSVSDAQAGKNTRKNHDIYERPAATCMGRVDCKLCGCCDSWSKKAVSSTVTSVEAFLAQIPDTDYHLFLPQNDKIKKRRKKKISS